ncbi:hypothetical protein ACFYZ9_18430 [Streptomyces sp. NPDC001691]|uniref:hypothetical protein n=1 Tax=Streptomyces sp. NPDC001691 TaxID=3364600 RepID=UPI0036A7A28C
MAGARVGFPRVCDRDEQVAGPSAQARLVAVRDSSVSADRLRLRDVLGGEESYAEPITTSGPGAARATSLPQPGAPSAVAGTRGPGPGALALSR